MKLSVVIAGGYKLERVALRQTLEKGLEQVDARVVGDTKDPEELVGLIERQEPDIVLAEMDILQENGCQALLHIKELGPDIRVLGFARETQDVIPCLAGPLFEAGVSGLLSMGASINGFERALEIVANGASLPIPLKSLVLDATLPRLSRREKQVLALFVRGWKTKEIASELDRSVWTVHTYFQRIKEKLGITTKDPYVFLQLATRLGLVDPEKGVA